jgi:D-3-phosphoglycerate dehydrogenase
MKVLLSAPYLINELDRFQPLLEQAGVKLEIAQVEERLDASELMRYAGKVDGVICGDDEFNADVLRAYSPRLKVISKWGTGIDSIDSEAAAQLEISVHRTPNAFTDPVADSVLAYVLAFARQAYAMDRQVKAGLWSKTPARSLNESTLGVIGVGNIGKAVLSRAKSFGARLLGNDIVEISADFVDRVGVEMVQLETLLRTADFVSLNCDLNPTSHHLMNRERLQLMKPESVLINTARGPVVDEQALVEALTDGWIAGAALDVFEHEPLPATSPLREMKNVLLAPHNANSGMAAKEAVHWNTLQNLIQGLDLEWPETENPEPGPEA